MFRDIVQGVAKNTSIMLFQQVVTWGSTFLVMLLMPRYLGPVEFGWLFLAISITQIFRVVVEYGGNYLVAKSVARSPERTAQILVDAIGFRTVFSILSFAIIVVFTFVAGYAPMPRLIIWVYAASLLWAGAITAYYASFQGREKMQYTSMGAVAERVFNSVAVVVAILLGAPVLVLAVLFVIGGFLQLVALFAFKKNIVDSLPKISWKGTMAQVKDGFPYFLFTIFSVVYYRIDSVMLSWMSPEAVLGWYGGACRLFETMHFFPFIFSTAIYPVLSRLWNEEGNSHARAIQKSLEFMVIAGTPITIGLVAFARNIVQILYGLAQFGPTVPVLQILSTGLLLIYIDIILGTTLLSSDKQRQQSVLALCAIPVKLILNYVLIGYFQATAGNGALGGALSTVITELGLMVAMVKLVPRSIFAGFPFRAIGKSLLAGLAMVGIIGIGGYLDLPWAGVAVLGVLAYAGLLIVLKTLEPVEEEFLQSLLRVNLRRAGRALGIAKSEAT